MWGFMERHHILKKMTNFLMEFDISENCFELGKAGHHGYLIKFEVIHFFGDLSGQAKKMLISALCRLSQFRNNFFPYKRL